MDAISIRNVSKTFHTGKKKFKAVDDVTLHIRKGEIFGLLGPNGAGKTTLLNMILSVVEQDSGTIHVLGKNLLEKKELIEKIGLVSPGANFHWVLSPLDVLQFFARAYGLPKEKREEKIAHLIKTFGLEKQAHTQFDDLSTGQKMRLMLARAMLNDPEIILLDEPTLGLDPHIAVRVRDEIKRINKEQGTTIVLTSHYMQEVESLAERIAFMHQGKIIDIGSLAEVKQKHFSSYELHILTDTIKQPAVLKKKNIFVKGKRLLQHLNDREDVSETLILLHRLGMRIIDVKIKRPSLEDYFLKIVNRERKKETTPNAKENTQ